MVMNEEVDLVTDPPIYSGYVLVIYKRRCSTRINFKYFMSFIYINESLKTIRGKYKQILLENFTD